MSSRDIVNAFDECVDMLQQGMSVDACLARFPEFTDELEGMLLTAQQAQQLGVPSGEVSEVTGRIRQTVMIAAASNPNRSRITPLATLLASAALILLAFAAGYILAPNDPQTPAANTIPSADRIEDLQPLIDEGQLGAVEFVGIVTQQDASQWIVGGIPVNILADTAILDAIAIDDQVEVIGFQGEFSVVFAREIILVPNELDIDDPEACVVEPRQEIAIIYEQPIIGEQIAELEATEDLPTVIFITESIDNWYGILVEDGQIGWLMESQVIVSGDCDDVEFIDFEDYFVEDDDNSEGDSEFDDSSSDADDSSDQDEPDDHSDDDDYEEEDDDEDDEDEPDDDD